MRSIVRGQRAVKRSIMLKGPPRIAPLMRMSTWKCESKKWATAAIRYVAAGHTIGETLRVCGLRAHRAHGTHWRLRASPRKALKIIYFCTSVTLSEPRAIKTPNICPTFVHRTFDATLNMAPFFYVERRG